MAYTTTTESGLPFIVRLANGLGPKLNRFGLRAADLTRDRLMAAASRETGLSDFGDGDFLAPLDVLLDGYEKDAGLSFLGRFIVQQTILRLLSNRLKIQRDFTKYPEILEQPVPRPLFVFGLPRTGTTLLFNLLAQEPGARIPLWWELFHPSPPPQADARETDPRIATADRANRFADRIFPMLRSAHATTAKSPEECIFIFQMVFSTPFFALTHHMPMYARWLMQHDMLPAYRYYRSVLQLLQWRTPGAHWTLKSPHHLFHLDALLDVFPDACIVFTHRDVAKTVGSTCSMLAILRRVNSRDADPARIGSTVLEFLARGVERTMAVRERAGASRFYDLDYRDLVADPKGQVRRVLDHFGYRFDESMTGAMDRWMTENRQHKHGVHRYSLEQFGLSAEQVEARFAHYIARYDVAMSR